MVAEFKKITKVQREELLRQLESSRNSRNITWGIFAIAIFFDLFGYFITLMFISSPMFWVLGILTGIFSIWWIEGIIFILALFFEYRFHTKKNELKLIMAGTSEGRRYFGK